LACITLRSNVDTETAVLIPVRAFFLILALLFDPMWILKLFAAWFFCSLLGCLHYSSIQCGYWNRHTRSATRKLQTLHYSSIQCGYWNWPLKKRKLFWTATCITLRSNVDTETIGRKVWNKHGTFLHYSSIQCGYWNNFKWGRRPRR